MRDGQLAAPARAAVDDPPLGSVFQMMRPVDKMDAQAARAFVHDESPQGVIGRSSAAILHRQDIETRQSGVPGKVSKVGEQATHVFQSIRVDDHPHDQMGPTMRRLDVRRCRCGRDIMRGAGGDGLGPRLLPPKQPPGPRPEPFTLGAGHVAPVLAEEAVESSQAGG